MVKWSTNRVIEELGDHTDEPKKVLSTIHKIDIRDDLARYDLVMRAWATHEPEVAEIVASVDQARIEIVREQIRRLGFEGKDLDLRTNTFVVTTSLWTVIHRDASGKKRRQQLAGVLDLLTDPPVR